MYVKVKVHFNDGTRDISLDHRFTLEFNSDEEGGKSLKLNSVLQFSLITFWHHFLFVVIMNGSDLTREEVLGFPRKNHKML